MSSKQELGRQIKEGRDTAGLTQAELASQLNVSRQMIGRYEAGRDAPGIDILMQLVRLLEIEFRIRGIIVTFEHESRRPRLLHKQFRFEFEKPCRFDGAQVEITPKQGKLLQSKGNYSLKLKFQLKFTETHSSSTPIFV